MTAAVRHGAEICQAIGLVLILSSAIARTCVGVAVLPYWDLSPLSTDAPNESTLTPFMSLSLDTLVFVGIVLLVAGASRVRWRIGLAVLAGGFSILLTLIPSDPPGSRFGDFRDLLIGMTWLSALAGAWGLSHLRARWLVAAGASAVLAAAVVPAFYGMHQYLVAHDRLVEQFERNRAESLASQGFAEDSVQARSFERRLSQREASGWFGLSNVFASMAGAGTLALASIVLCSALVRRGPPVPLKPIIVAGIGFSACAIALVMTHSKGGYAATAFGAALAGAVLFTRGRWSRILARPTLLVAFAVTVPLLAVVVRGVVGERIVELSLLFRWQYLAASVRIMVEHWQIGVRPDGFQDAYLLAKLPRSPEAVASPHSVLFDWLACLGVLGVGFVIALLAWSRDAVRSAVGSPHEPSPGAEPEADARHARLAAMLTVTLGVGAAIFWQRSVLVPDLAMVLVLAVLASLAVATSIAEIVARRPGVLAAALLPAVLALLAHAQIEMTPIRAASAGWFFAVLGLAAAGGRATGDEDKRRPNPVWLGAVAGCLAVPTIAAGMWAIRAHAWEAELRNAADLVRPIGIAERAMAAARSPLAEPPPEQRLAWAQATIAEAVPEAARQGLPHALHEYAEWAFPLAREDLDRAEATLRGETRTLREVTKLWAAYAARANGDQRAERLVEAAGVAFVLAELDPTSATCSAAASYFVAAAQARLAQGRAAEASRLSNTGLILLEQAVWLAPYEIAPARSLALFLASQPGHEAAAADAARLALRNNANHELDQQVQLTDSEVAELERVAALAPPEVESEIESPDQPEP